MTTHTDEWGTGKREGYVETPRQQLRPRPQAGEAFVQFLHSLGGWLALTGLGLASFTAYNNNWDYRTVTQNPMAIIVFVVGLLLRLSVRPN